MEPRAKFTADLKVLVAAWRAEGCEVIVGIDVNEDVSRLSVGSFRHHMQEVGLHEAILASHHGPYPATQNRNLTATPIDGIFVSAGVSVKASGYLEFHQYFQSDHRGLWIDIDLHSTLGAFPLLLRPSSATNHRPACRPSIPAISRGWISALQYPGPAERAGECLGNPTGSHDGPPAIALQPDPPAGIHSPPSRREEVPEIGNGRGSVVSSLAEDVGPT